MSDWLGGPVSDEYTLSSDFDDRWRTGGTLDEVIEEAHLDPKHILEGIERFVRDREKRLSKPELGHLRKHGVEASVDVDERGAIGLAAADSCTRRAAADPAAQDRNLVRSRARQATPGRHRSRADLQKQW